MQQCLVFFLVAIIIYCLLTGVGCYLLSEYSLICMLVILQIQTVAKTAGMHRNEWVENADRWVAGFLEMFEEGCHKMVSSSMHN